MGANNSIIVPDNHTRILNDIAELNMKIQCLIDYANGFGVTEGVQRRYKQFNTHLKMKYSELDYYSKKEQEMKEKREERICVLRDLYTQMENEYARLDQRTFQTGTYRFKGGQHN